MTSSAIVLHTRKYADDRLIVETYTEVAGAVTFIVRISHGRCRTTIPHTLFQPLALLDISWEEHTRSSLIKPTAARPTTHDALTLTHDPVKSALTLFLAEFFRAVLRQEPPSPPIFQYISNAVRWIAEALPRTQSEISSQTEEHGRAGKEQDNDRGTSEGLSLANAHIAILIRMASLLGIRPTQEELLPICPAAYRDAVPQLLRMNLANQHLYRFTRAQRAELLHIILLYYRQHLPAFPEMKSVEVLTQIFV